MECWTPGAVMVPQLPQRIVENDHSEHVFDVGQLFGAVLSFGTVDVSKRVRFGLKIGFCVKNGVLRPLLLSWCINLNKR
jgi:hypothetical protein